MTEIWDSLTEQPALIACNHTLSDAVKILARLVPTSITVIAPSKNNDLPVDEILAAINAQQSVAFFPEGPVSPDGAIHRGSLDLGWLILAAKVLVLPVAIVPNIDEDVDDDWELRLGDPLDFSRYWSSQAMGDEIDRYLLRAVSDDVAAALVRVSGLDYHDQPAATHQRVKVSFLTRLKQGAEPAFAAERARVQLRADRRAQELSDIDNAEAQTHVDSSLP